MLRSDSLQISRQFCLTLGVAAGLFGTWGSPASAQQTGEVNEVEEVTVTGTRLRNAVVSASPVTMISEEALLQRGPVTIDEALKSFPQLKPDNGATQTLEGGAGVAKANLRALGPTRTLVLVNGRRFVPASSGGEVDLASIPETLVSRVDLLTGGASAVYGSDAIGGAINIILRDDFEGASTNYSFAQTTRGDATTHKANLTLGGNFADGKGNAVFDASYYDSGEVFARDRSFSRLPLFDEGDTLVPIHSNAVLGGRILVGGTDYAGVGPAEGECTEPLGVRFASGGAPVPYCVENNFDSAFYLQLRRPARRYQLTSLSHYDLSPRVTAFVEGYFVNTLVDVPRNPDQFRGTVTLPGYATNPTLTQATRDFLAANAGGFDPTGSGTAAVPIRIRLPALGIAHSEYTRDSLQLTGGFRGQTPVFGENDWSWELYYSYQSTTQDEQVGGQMDLGRLALGSDVVVNNGVATCRLAIEGCVPVNILGTDVITPAMADFLTPDRVNRSLFDRRMAGASISGEPFDLPAGAFAVALGVEHREESYDFLPSPKDQAGSFQNFPGGSTSNGAVRVKEVFLELGVPLLRDLPGIRRLALETGARYSDYTTIGGVLTYKGGLRWQPIESVDVRASYNRAIRAPNLGELFSARRIASVSSDDPCDVRSGPSAAVRAICVQQGVPAASIDTFRQLSAFSQAITGGNPSLTEETADTYTAGITFQPASIPAFQVGVDYFRIKVDGAVSQITAQQYINECFRQLDISSIFCSSISRDAAGFLSTIDTSVANIASRLSSGIDFNLSWSTNLPSAMSFGDRETRLSIGLSNVYQFHDEYTTFSDQPPIECAGHYDGVVCSGLGGLSMTPKYAGYLQTGVRNGPMSLALRLNWVGRFTPGAGVNPVVKEAPLYTTLDINGDIDLTERLSISAGILNAFDKQPPVLGFRMTADANTDQVLYDVMGRRFFIRAGMDF